MDSASSKTTTPSGHASPHRHPTKGHAESVLSRHMPKPSKSATMKKNLRALLRDIAQPVAVVTSLKPEVLSSEQNNSGRSEDVDHLHFHGTTLSSFTSISMDPHPLVAFALRIPSRMASTLSSFASHLTSARSPNSHPNTTHPIQHRNQANFLKAHMVINLLSHAQVDVAQRFSRPDLFPHPFASTPYSLTKEGLPLLHGSLGAISCRLVAQPLKLRELGLEAGTEEDGVAEEEGNGVVSELFIARVVRVETLPVVAPSSSLVEQNGDREQKSLSPLLYYRRDYTTC